MRPVHHDISEATYSALPAQYRKIFYRVGYDGTVIGIRGRIYEQLMVY